MDYFDKAETWDRATLETVQLARLKTTIQQASRAPFYAKRLAGILDDLAEISFEIFSNLRVKGAQRAFHHDLIRDDIPARTAMDGTDG